MLIGNNDILLKVVNEEYSLLNALMLRVELFSEEDTLVSRCVFEINHLGKRLKIILKFSEVKEFSLYTSSNYYFYNVESYKFLKINNLFYLSIDPFDESEEISKNDQDFILAEEVVGWVEKD